MLLTLAGIVGMVYFWKKDKKKRNIAAIIAIISFVMFGFSTDPAESDNAGEETNYEYEIVEQELSELGNFDRLELRVVTPEELNKEQIEELLMQLEEEVEEDNAGYNAEIDDLYIFLFENELIVNEGYTLGRLVRQDGVTEIDARQKNWDEQPSDEEYELYVKFMDKALELETEAIEEDDFAVVEDDEIAKEVAENEDVDAQTVLDSTSKVSSFMMMNEE